MSRPPSVSPTAPISSRPGASRARAAAPRCSRIRTCAAPISARSRVCRARGPRYHDPRPAAGARAPRRRPLRSRRGRPLARLRRPQGPQRRPRRADHARRLRRLLALGTLGFRSAARASARRRRRGGDARERRLLDQPVHRARVDAEGAHRGRPCRARLDARHLRGWSRPGPRGGGERVRVRRAVPRGRRPRHLPGRARRAAPGALRAMSRRGWLALGVTALAALAAVPLVVRRDDVLNFLFLVLLSVGLAQSWNVVAGYAGQINLGHAAFFGLGALVTRTLWIAEWPVLAGAALGALAATAFALLVGAVAFRLRGAYFAIGTLALGEILRITVGNVLPEVSTLPTATIGAYRLADRYYFALALAAVAVGVVAALERSRAGLGMQAVREDEEAAEASGVGTLRLKLLALVLSTALAGLAGGLFAYYHISYYPAHPWAALDL